MPKLQPLRPAITALPQAGRGVVIRLWRITSKEKKMQPMFTIHVGEYLVGEALEEKFKKCEIWTPAKDHGIDLLLSAKDNTRKNTGIQVKYSKDHVSKRPSTAEKFIARGWWTLKREGIKKSSADLWILAPYSFSIKKIQNVYLWITKDNKCFETRGLKTKEIDNLTNGNHAGIENIKARDFTIFLNNWDKIKRFIT
jgi:hypothetical protein